MKNYQKPFWIVRSRMLTGVLGMSLSVLLGCGGAPGDDKITGSVEISVTFAGEPVPEGSVQLSIPEQGKATGGDLDVDGNLSLAEVEVGNYIVFIAPPPEAPPEADKPASAQEDYENIPPKYRSESTSPLKAEVKEGENKFSFELKE